MEKYKIFNNYKNQIINASDIEDAKSILNIATMMASSETEKKLLESLINDNRYNIRMDINKLIVYLNIINMLNYYSDAETIINDLQINIDDVVQINTFKRLLRNKTRSNINTGIICKNCPHCSHANYVDSSTSYIVCGYGNKGYDWKGCGKDWCFICGKKLCKSWNNNMLFNKLNRYHDNKCCKAHSHKSKSTILYEDEYCMCKNEYVNRKI